MRRYNDNGVVRYVGDEILMKLYDLGILDLNELRKFYHEGRITKQQMKKIYRGVGVSVSLMEELDFTN